MSKKIFASNDKTKYAIIDDDIFETIQEMGLKFRIQNKGNCIGHFYSTTEIKLPCMTKKKRLLLHRFVWILKMGEEPSSTIDHIDIDPSNNRFENLRLATRKEQNRHRGKLKNNKSGFIGVCHQHRVDKRRKKNNVSDYWLASIMKPDGKREVKYFPFTDAGLIEAAKYYDAKAIEYHGEFACLNFPDEIE